MNRFPLLLGPKQPPKGAELATMSQTEGLWLGNRSLKAFFSLPESRSHKVGFCLPGTFLHLPLKAQLPWARASSSGSTRTVCIAQKPHPVGRRIKSAILLFSAPLPHRLGSPIPSQLFFLPMASLRPHLHFLSYIILFPCSLRL